MHRILMLLFFFIVPFRLKSQILPKEGSMLNYRLIGFSFPEMKKIAKYTIEISAGLYELANIFRANIISGRKEPGKLI